MSNQSTIIINNVVVTKFDNSSRDNFLSWKRSIDAALSRHPNVLLTIVEDNELAASVKTRIKKDAKALGEEVDTAYLQEFITEYDTAAYYIVIETVANKTVLKELERKYSGTMRKMISILFARWESNPRPLVCSLTL